MVPPLKQGEPVGCYRSPGGHWRISGRTREEVVEFLRGQIPKTSRQRKENAYPLAGDRTKTPREAWANALPGAWRWAGETSKRVHSTPWACIGRRSSPAEKYRFLEEVVRGVLDQSQSLQEWLHGDASTRERVQSLTEMFPGRNIENGDLPLDFFEVTLPEPLFARNLARHCGLRIRTFYRWFPGWRRAVQKLVGAKLRKRFFDDMGGIVAGDEGIDFDGMDARNGWRESDATP